MSLQGGLVTLLTEGLPTVRVLGYPGSLDGITGPTVMAWATDLKYLEAAPIGHYQVDLTVLIYTAHQDPQRAEDDLSTSLDAVLGVLWDSTAYLLTGAQRTISQDNTIHSWTLTVSGGITITNVYGSAVYGAGTYGGI